MANNGNDKDADYRIRDGDFVVLKRGDVYKSAQILRKKKVIFEKQWIFLDNAVGEFYGSTFEIEGGGSLKRRSSKQVVNTTDKEAGTDNRNIVDDGKSQKLTRDDIETLKEQGLKGQEIVQQLIDNSSTFKEKTEFAQEKYIKKKKKKYDSNVTVLKPSGRILALMYHGREPSKICHLRFDTLAMMLAEGNVRAHNKMLVFETCAGLVLGAVMERMGGYGSVVQFYHGDAPTRAGMLNFGFPAHFHRTLYEFPVCQVKALLAGSLQRSEGVNEAGVEKGQELELERVEDTGGQAEPAGVSDTLEGEDGAPGENQEMEVAVEGQLEDDDAKEKLRNEMREKKQLEKKVRLEEKREKMAAAVALLEGRSADGLVIASRFHPCSVLLALLKFVAPSRPFVVYCQYIQPLIECYNKLKEQGGAINIRLMDSWLRHYQVLPNRTHPVLSMSGGGGYLLAGTTVVIDSPKSEATTTKVEKSEEPASKKSRLEGPDSMSTSSPT